MMVTKGEPFKLEGGDQSGQQLNALQMQNDIRDIKEMNESGRQIGFILAGLVMGVVVGYIQGHWSCKCKGDDAKQRRKKLRKNIGK